MLERIDTPNGHDLPVEPTEDHVNGDAHGNGNGNGNGARHAAYNRLPVNGDSQPHEEAALALFCFESPDSVVGRDLISLAAVVARRGSPVHVFSRRGFATDAAGVSIHVLGDCGGGDLMTQAETFTQRACNAFLGQFGASRRSVTLLGCEWTAAPVVSLLRGLRRADAVLSFHSFERQRSDLGSDISRRIDEIETTALREAKTILIHDDAAETKAAELLPGCACRLRRVTEPFPVEKFDLQLDPGAIKARYQIGPTDPTILYVGDLDERYGPDLLVRAMPGVLKRHPQARLIVVGDGQLLWPLRVYARYLLIEHAVRLVGDVRDQAMAELVRAVDVVAVPSRTSTPWWPIQAAWAASRPVVATHEAAPALTEHDGDSVLVFPSENSLVWGIDRVLNDAELRRSLAEHSAVKLDRRFGWGATATLVEEVMGVERR
jgi:glycosyltransferase involved in cell wall biosynthesis